MTRYSQGPRHARRGPYRGTLLPAMLLTASSVALVVLLVWVLS